MYTADSMVTTKKILKKYITDYKAETNTPL